MLPIASRVVRDAMYHRFALGDTEPLLNLPPRAPRARTQAVRRGLATTLRAAARRLDAPRQA